MAETLAERMRRLGGGGETLAERMRRLTGEPAPQARRGLGLEVDLGRAVAGEVASTLPRMASALGGVAEWGARRVGAERLASRFDEAQQNLSELANLIERSSAPQTTAGKVVKVLTGVGKYVVAGPYAGTLMATTEAAADPRYSQTALVGELVPGPVGAVARRASETPFGRAVGEVALNEAVAQALKLGVRGVRAGARAMGRATDFGEGMVEAGARDLERARFDVGDVPQRITDPRRLLPGGPATGDLTGPGIPLRGPESPDVRAAIERATNTRRLARGPLITPPPTKLPPPDLPPTPTGGREIAAARTASGGLRDLSKVHSDALMREYAERADAMLNAQERAQYAWIVDEGGHMGDPGRVVPMADRRGPGPSRQAKALRNIEQIDQTMRRIEAEWARRGLPEDELYRGLDLLDAEKRAAKVGDYESVERAGLSSLVEPEYRVGDEEGFDLFERSRRRYRDPTQADLFAQRKDDVVTFDSPERAATAADRVAQTAPPQFIQRSGRAPTSRERLHNVRSAKAARVWVDVRGQRVQSPEDIHGLVAAFRDPQAERLHVLLLDAEGRVLSHSMDSSGAIDYSKVAVDRRWVHTIEQRAKRTGATRVLFAHNHPSGYPTPSPDDIAITGVITEKLQERGLSVDGMYVIDHTKGTYVRNAGPGSYEKVPVRIPERGPDWLDAHGPRIAGPGDAVALARDAELRSSGTIVYLSTQNEVVAVEPATARALARPERWLGQRLRAHAARRAFVLVDEASAGPGLYDDLARRVNLARLGRPAHPLDDVLDVAILKSGGAYESAAEVGRFPDPQFSRPAAGKPARRLFERPVSEADVPADGRGQRSGRGTEGGAGPGRERALPADARVGEFAPAVREQAGLFGPGELPPPVDRRGQQALFDDLDVGRSPRPVPPEPADAEALRKLARRNERYAEGDAVPLAEAEYRAAGTESLPGQGTLFSNPIGPAVRHVATSPGAGAVVGAGVGAAADEENRLRGAAIGAGVGFTVGLTGSYLARRAASSGRPLRTVGDPDVDAVLSTIARGKRAPAGGDDLLTATQKAYTAVVDELYPLREFGRQVGGSDRLSQLATQARGWESAAYQYTRDELRPLLQATQPVREQVMALAKAQRALALLDQGLEKTDIPRDVLERTVAKLSARPDVAQGAEALQAYYRKLLAYKAGNGVLAPEQYRAIVESGDFYTPFTREFEQGVRAGGQGAGGGRLVNRGTGVRRMDTGKARAQTVDPFEQAILDTFEAHRTVAKQRVSNMVAAIVEAEPDAAHPFIRRVASRAEAKAGRVVEANVAGERRTYEVIEKDLFDAWAAFDPRSQNLAVKLLAPFKRTLQAGVTILPDFAVANAIRDNVMTGIQYRPRIGSQVAGAAAGALVGATTSEDRGRGALIGAGLGLGIGSIAPNIARTLGAMRHIVKDDAVYREFLREGGPSLGGFYPKNLKDAHRLMSELERTGVSAADLLSPRQWWEGLQTIGRLAEQAPRLAAFEATRAAGGTAAEAVFRAADISLDFGKIGSHTKGIAATTAFWNAKVQGWDKLARLLKEPKTWGVAAATITAPSIALWTINAENPEYWERPQWERNLFWLVPKDGGGFWRIPKPFEVGFIFGSLPERILDFARQRDPETLTYALQDMIGNTFEGTVPLPTLPATVAENVANFDFFTRRPVVARPDLPSELQFDERTSSVAKLAGQATGVSPQKIENTIRDVTGGAGKIALSLTDRIARLAGADARPLPPDAAAVPGLGDLARRFITAEGTTSDAEQALWRRFARAESAYRGALDLEKYGTPAELQAYLRSHRDDLAAYGRLRESTDALREVRAARRALARRRDLTPAQRERGMRKLAELAQDFATQGVAGGRDETVSSVRPR